MLISVYDLTLFLEKTTDLENQKIEFSTAIKILKLRRAAEKIVREIQSQKSNLMEECIEKDEEGKYKVDKGGLIVKQEKEQYFAKELNNLKNPQQIPDIYFSENELSKMDLTLGQLASFIPFTKE